MGLKIYECPICKFEHKTLKTLSEPVLCEDVNKNYTEKCSTLILSMNCPSTKLVEIADKATGRRKLKDMDKVLKERSRNHSREVELDDNIQINSDNKFQVSRNLLNEKGERRRKIDDI